MPSRTNKQLAGKYKNVPFLVRREALNNVGQTFVKHSYPKTSVQYMEPMGQEPFDATIDIFFSGDNFKEDFQKFQKAIQDKSPGRLFLPTFGVFNNIVATPTTFNAEQTSIGEITTSINFSESITRPSPTGANITAQDVSELAQVARNTLLVDFSENYAEPGTLNNIITAQGDAIGLANSIKTITGLVKETRNFLRKIDQNIRNASQYASLLLNPGNPEGFLQSVALAFSANAAFAVFKKISTIGSSLPNAINDIKADIIPKPSTVIPAQPTDNQIDTNINIWDIDTSERIERNNIRLTVVNIFRITGLIGMYEAAASSLYTTTQEVEAIIATLEEYYTSLIENDTTNIIIPTMKQTLDELRGLTDIVLENKRQQAFTVTEIEVVRPTSAFLLAYELYGETLHNEDQLEFAAEIIRGLNRSKIAHGLKGTIKVVEIVR